MPPEPRIPGCSVGRESGRGERVGGRVARAPGCGRCPELLTPAAWLPPASQSSNKWGRRRGRRRSQESGPLHSPRSPSGFRQRALLLGGVLAVGVGGGPEGASLSDTFLSCPPCALRWPVGHRPTPTSPFRPSGVWTPQGTSETLQLKLSFFTGFGGPGPVHIARSAPLPGACSLQPRHSGSVWLWVTVGGGVDVLPRFPGPPWSSHAMVEDGLPETGDSPPQASTSLHFSKSFLLHQWACQAAGTCSPTQWRTGDLPDGQSSISLNL
nr:uncharacterized protein LOC105106675 [Camelus dromedarius]